MALGGLRTHLAWCTVSHDEPQQIHPPQTSDIFRMSFIIRFVQIEPQKSRLLAQFYCLKLETGRSPSESTQKSISKKHPHISSFLHDRVSRKFLSISKLEDGILITAPQEPCKMPLPHPRIPDGSCSLVKPELPVSDKASCASAETPCSSLCEGSPQT